MFVTADTISMTMAFLAAPSDLRMPERAPSIIMKTASQTIGVIYQWQRSPMSPAPIMLTTGSMQILRIGMDISAATRQIMIVCDARMSASAFSWRPRYLAMAVDAPTPMPVPTPPIIQYRGEIELTAELASDPSPEHQAVSTNMFTWMTRKETSMGTVMDLMALRGSPSIVSRSASGPVSLNIAMFKRDR